MNTSCQLRGHYARVCVLVNLEKQLMSGFSLDGEDYMLEYEGLHLFCSKCGVYGHRPETCPTKKNENSNEGNVDINNSDTQQGSDMQRSGNGSDVSPLPEQWRVVQKQRRPRKTKENKDESRMQN